MAHSFIAQTLGKAWIKSIQYVLQNGEPHFDEDVSLLEVRSGMAFSITHPSTSDPIIEQWGDPSVTKRMLKKFSKGVKMSDRPFTYGQLIYSKNGVNQFEWLLERIRNKPETKSATISLITEGSNAANLPCLVCFDAKLRNGAIDLHFFFRSQNIFGRQYANLIAISELQNSMAAELSCKVGSMCGYIASPHIYEYDICDAKKLISGMQFDNKDRYYSHGPLSVRNR